MEILDKLENLAGFGTSMITMPISTNQDALVDAVATLNREYNIATNIKSRV